MKMAKNKNLMLTYETEDSTRSMLLQYAIGRFEWEGLPPGLTSHKLEEWLLFNGTCIAFKEGKFRILPARPAGGMNEFGVPVNYIAQAWNASYQTDTNKAVVIHANSAHRGMQSLFETTAKTLNECLNAVRINVRMQKNPWTFGGTQDEIKNLQACFEKVNENGVVLYTSVQNLNTLDAGKRFFPLNTPLIASDLYRVYRETLNHFLTLLGLDNVPIEKKERLITDEAHGNDCAILFNRQNHIEERERACEQINKMFGLNITVKWKGCKENVATAQTDESERQADISDRK